MKIKIFSNFNKFIEKEPVEMVERKGIGHPDCLADLVAETFSNKYSIHCLKKFGIVLNHWVDKVLLSGAKAEINYGEKKILKPINVYLFGKVTLKMGNKSIDVSKIFKESVHHVFYNIFKNKELFKYINYYIDINDGIGLDHPKEFYLPNKISELKNIKDAEVSNDTIMASAYAPYSQTEFLVIKLENYINSKFFKKRFPETGYDVKVMVIRIKNNFDITLCLPFIAERTKDFPFYKNRLTLIKQILLNKVKRFIENNKIKISINTKDRAKYGYITAFGTALDKGDYGAVGRGNRYNGVMAINREINFEAVSGKNPICHSGKLYNVISQEIANQIYKKYRIENYINIGCKNGELLTDPSYVIIKFFNKNITKEDINRIVYKNLGKINTYSRKIICSDPVSSFRKYKTF